MRKFHIFSNQAKTWIRIVCWFLCIHLFLSVFAWCDHKIVLQINKQSNVKFTYSNPWILDNIFEFQRTLIDLVGEKKLLLSKAQSWVKNYRISIFMLHVAVQFLFSQPSQFISKFIAIWQKKFAAFSRVVPLSSSIVISHKTVIVIVMAIIPVTDTSFIMRGLFFARLRKILKKKIYLFRILVAECLQMVHPCAVGEKILV